jgi:hypothetical protein
MSCRKASKQIRQRPNHVREDLSEIFLTTGIRPQWLT